MERFVIVPSIAPVAMFATIRDATPCSTTHTGTPPRS